MIRIVVILVVALGMTVGYAAPSDACGVKLTVKSPKVQKRVNETSHPSHILVIGRPPSKRLTNWLEQAGHTVESTKQASVAKRKDYAIVIADPETVNEARASFPRSRVVTRSGTLSSNVKRIEMALAGSPSSGDRATTMASRESSTRARPARVTQPRRSRPAAAQPQALEGVATVEARATVDVALTRPEEPAVEPAPEPAVSTSPTVKPREARESRRDQEDARWLKEVFFGTNRVSFNSRTRARLQANARWLEQNPDVTITIEGHTDSAGPAEYNKVLGERRAEAVRAFLVEQGVDPGRIEVISYGEERPFYKNDRKNRRVLLVKN